MTRQLGFEELEQRIAPTVIASGGSLSFTDGDDDQILISYFGPLGSEVSVLNADGLDMDDGDDIGTMTVTNSDYSSLLTVENLGGGNDDTLIVNGIHYTTAGRSTGLLSLDGQDSAVTVFGAGATITSLGAIDTLLIHGDVNFDAGAQSITALGNIGLIEVNGDMILATTGGGLADIQANGGDHDISFLRVTGSVTVGDAGPALTPLDIGTGVTVLDDAGDGTLAQLQVTMAGPGAAGSVTAIPVAGGGSVLSKIEVTGAAAVTVTSSRGGDVTEVVSHSALSTLTIAGAADTDLYLVTSVGLGAVANRTVGGDIVGVVSTTGIGSIATLAKGNLGAAFTGAGNFYPFLIGGTFLPDAQTHAATTIGSITAGGIVNTYIGAAGIFSIKAGPGGITGTEIEAITLGPVSGSYIDTSTISGQNSITSVTAGAGGITGSSIISHGTINLVSTPGSITNTGIIAEFKDGPGNVTGGSVNAIQAGGVYGSTFSSFGGFGSVSVSGMVVHSTIEARFHDDVLNQEVGGNIGSFSATGVHDESLVKAVQISSVAVGLGGVTGLSYIDANVLTRVAVRGDVTNGAIINGNTSVGTVAIGGDLAFDAGIGSGGSMQSLSVAGAIVGGDVLIAGNLASLSARGGISGLGTTIGVGGNLTSFTVGSSIAGVDVPRAGVDRPSIDIEITGHVGRMSVAGGVSSAVIGIYGGIDSLSIGGTVSKGTVVIEGNTGVASVRGDLNYTDLTFGRDGAAPVTVGLFSVGGGISSSGIEAFGNVTTLAARGSVVSSSVQIEGNAGAMSFGRGVYGSYLRVTGDSTSFTANTAVQNSQTLFDGGIAQYTVKGSLYFSNVGTTHYDGDGNPLGGRIGTLTANDINGANIFAFGGIGSITAKGTIFGATIEAVGRDESGTGSIVGGGNIGQIVSRGLNQSGVIAYTDLGSITLGDGGIGAGSYVGTITGNLTSIATRGLIFGEVEVAGNLVGSILSAGDDAVSLGNGPALYFRDANGVITGGTLHVSGTIGGIVS